MNSPLGIEPGPEGGGRLSGGLGADDGRADGHSPGPPRSRARGFRHSALIVESDRSLRELLVPAVRQALTEADSVFVAVSDRTARLLRSELGADADAVDWGDTAAFYQRLGFAYEAFRRFLTGARDAGRRVHVFAEPSVGGPDDDPSPEDRTGAYLAYEAFCNEAYAGFTCGAPAGSV